MSKRVWSLILALVMLVSVFSVVVSADEETAETAAAAETVVATETTEAAEAAEATEATEAALPAETAEATEPAETKESQYNDVDGHWGEIAIETWTDYRIVQGFGDGSYRPDNTMTRAQVAQVFTNLLQLKKKADTSQFTDIDQNAWYADAIAKVYKRGIMIGTGPNTMDPNAPLTREQLMTIFCRALNLEEQTTIDKEYADIGEVASWAKGYVYALVNKGYIQGLNNVGYKDDLAEGTLAPKMVLNRAMLLQLIYNVFGQYQTGSNVVVTGAESGKATLVVGANPTFTGNITDDVYFVYDIDDSDAAAAAADQSAAGGTVSSGNVESINLIGDAYLRVLSGSTVNKVKAAPSAGKTAVVVDSGATVNTVTGTAVDVSGAGTVGKVESTNVTANTTTPIGEIIQNGADATLDGSATVKKYESNAESTKVADTIKIGEAVIKEGVNSATINANVGKITVESDDSTLITTGNVDNIQVDADNVTLDISGNTKDVVITTSGEGTNVNGEKVYQNGSTRVTPTAQKAATVAGHTHTFTDWTVIEEPDCWIPGLQRRTCTSCGAVDEELIPARHNEKELDTDGHFIHPYAEEKATCEENGKVWYKCAICGQAFYEEIPALGHAWDVGKVTKAPTCTDEGMITFTCMNDPTHVKTDTIQATGHMYITTAEKAATYTEDGYKTYTCANCGDEYTEVLPKLQCTNHSWNAGAITTAATCDKDGVRTYTCNVCGGTKTERIKALGHNWNDGVVTTAPTCTTTGVKTYTCSNDTTHKKTEPISALGHDWDDGNITTAATCETNGEITYTCKHNSLHQMTSVILATGHDLVKHEAKAPTCEAKGNVEYWTCKNCTDVFIKGGSNKVKIAVNGDLTGTEIPATGHKWDSGTITKAATLTEDGEITYTCQNDPTHKRTVKIEKLGECTWDDGTVTKPATCTADGEKTYTCTNHSPAHTKTEVIPATGHNYVATVVPPTCTTQGYTEHKCSACGDTYKDTYTPATGHKWSDPVTTKEATCEKEGVLTYTCIVCNATKNDSIPAKGHDFSGEPTFTWTETETGYTAKATFTCKNDSSHKKDVTASVAASATTATCTTGGTITYKATAVFNDTTYVAEKTVEGAAAMGHLWSSPKWTWTGNDTDGYTAASAEFTCLRDVTHKETKIATIKSDSTAAVTTYTASVTLGDNTYTDTKVISNLKYTLTLSIKDTANPAKVVTGSRVQYLDNDVLDQAMLILNDNYHTSETWVDDETKLAQVFGGEAEYHAMKDMVNAYLDVVNSTTNAEKTWQEYVAESNEKIIAGNEKPTVSLRTVYKNGVKANFSDLGKGSWEITYVLGAKSYTVTLTIA